MRDVSVQDKIFTMPTIELNINQSRRNDIQVLRAVAVLSVLLFHFTSLLKSGYLGVDMFFVISGYVIFPKILEIYSEKNSINRRNLLYNFYRKRFLRLFPTLATTIVIFNLLLILFTNSEEHSRILKQAIISLLGFANIGAYFNSGNYFHPNMNPYIHLWSLSVEMQIYFLIPLVFLLFKSSNIMFKNITIFISAISLILFVYSPINHTIFKELGLNDYFHNLDYYLTSNRIFEFGIGGLLALSKNKSLIKSSFKGIINISIFIILILPNNITILSTVGVVLLTGLALHFESFKMQSNKIDCTLVWIGDRSYSIYLVHLPVFYIVKYAAISPFNSNFGIINVSFILTFILGSCIYVLIENKYRRNNYFRYKFRESFVFFLVIPMIISLFLLEFTNRNYFGLMKVEPRPLASWDIDKTCGSNILPAPCQFRNSLDHHSILLVGDSHAAQISQTMKRVSKVLNYNLFVWSHCDFQLIDSGNMQEESCLENNDRILDWIRNERPTYVVISQRMHSETPKEDVMSGISAALNLGSNVIFIGNNPVFSDGAKFLTNELIGKYNPPKIVEMKSMDQDSIFAARKFEFLAGIPQVTYVDTLSLICESNLCSRYKDGKWLYWDAGHLSISGADLIEPKLLDAIKKNGN
jgi:peptidoglycan/LPS O-acetylase OafA/YrhL